MEIPNPIRQSGVFDASIGLHAQHVLGRRRDERREKGGTWDLLSMQAKIPKPAALQCLTRHSQLVYMIARGNTALARLRL